MSGIIPEAGNLEPHKSRVRKLSTSLPAFFALWLWMWGDQLAPASTAPAMMDYDLDLQAKINSFLPTFLCSWHLVIAAGMKKLGYRSAVSYDTWDDTNSQRHSEVGVELDRRAQLHIYHTALLSVSSSEYKRTTYSLHTYYMLNSSPPKFTPLHPHPPEHSCIIIPVY